MKKINVIAGLTAALAVLLSAATVSADSASSTATSTDMMTTSSVMPVVTAVPVAIQASVPAPSTSGNLSLGSTGSSVSTLQAFLAEDPHIYPAGSVTGYFGTLTKNAVMQFQLAYGLPMIGQVGPQTKAKINSIIASGEKLDVTAPVISNVSVKPFSQQGISSGMATTTRSASINWTTNELSAVKVFFGSHPLTMVEATSTFAAPTVNSDWIALSATATTTPNLTLTALTPNTTYYYVVQSSDQAGNYSVSPVMTFVSSN